MTRALSEDLRYGPRWCGWCEEETRVAVEKPEYCAHCGKRKVKLTRRQRHVRDAILAGAIVVWACDPDAVERWGEDPNSRPVLLHLDPHEPLGLSYAEDLQWRTLRPCRWLGLLNDCDETPYREGIA